MTLFTKRSFKFLGILGLLSLILASLLVPGCRQYNMYGFKSVTSDLLGGELLVYVQGSYGENYTVDGKKMADWAHPYCLSFAVQMPLELNLHKIIVKGIDLVGEESKKLNSLPTLESSRVYRPDTDQDAKVMRTRAVYCEKSSDEFEYETQLLSATIVVYFDEETFREETISIELETDFRKNWSNDWIDEKMSV